MNKEDIYKAIESLAKTQGFYGNVLSQIKNHPDILDILEMQDFKDILDLIIYFEQ